MVKNKNYVFLWEDSKKDTRVRFRKPPVQNLWLSFPYRTHSTGKGSLPFDSNGITEGTVGRNRGNILKDQEWIPGLFSTYSDIGILGEQWDMPTAIKSFLLVTNAHGLDPKVLGLWTPLGLCSGCAERRNSYNSYLSIFSVLILSNLTKHINTKSVLEEKSSSKFYKFNNLKAAVFSRREENTY